MRVALALLAALLLPVVPASAQTISCNSFAAAGCGISYGLTQGAGPLNSPLYCNIFGYAPGAWLNELPGISTQTELTITVSDPRVDIILLGSCDENDCVAMGSVVGNETVLTTCVEPGNHWFVTASTDSSTFGYTVSVDCQGCSPVPTGDDSFGVLKSRH